MDAQEPIILQIHRDEKYHKRALFEEILYHLNEMKDIVIVKESNSAYFRLNDININDINIIGHIEVELVKRNFLSNLKENWNIFIEDPFKQIIGYIKGVPTLPYTSLDEVMFELAKRGMGIPLHPTIEYNAISYERLVSDDLVDKVTISTNPRGLFLLHQKDK